MIKKYPSIPTDEEGLCLHCQEGSESNSQLVYMASISVDRGWTCCFYGDDDKMRVLFSSCLHRIHL